MILILKENADYYFNSASRKCRTYDEAKFLLRKRYNSSEKRSRILRGWQTLRLSHEFAGLPNES